MSLWLISCFCSFITFANRSFCGLEHFAFCLQCIHSGIELHVSSVFSVNGESDGKAPEISRVPDALHTIQLFTKYDSRGYVKKELRCGIDKSHKIVTLSAL